MLRIQQGVAAFGQTSETAHYRLYKSIAKKFSEKAHSEK